MIAFVSTTHVPMFFGATESTVFVVSAKDTNYLLLRGNHTRQSAKPPARLMAFIAGLLIDP